MASKVLTLATILALYTTKPTPDSYRLEKLQENTILREAAGGGGEGRGKSLRAFPSKNNTQRYD